MVEIMRHLRWVERHCKWIIRRLQHSPSQHDKHEALTMLTYLEGELGLARKLLEQ